MTPESVDVRMTFNFLWLTHLCAKTKAGGRAVE